jgi:hypothetical protein
VMAVARDVDDVAAESAFDGGFDRFGGDHGSGSGKGVTSR